MRAGGTCGKFNSSGMLTPEAPISRKSHIIQVSAPPSAYSINYNDDVRTIAARYRLRAHELAWQTHFGITIHSATLVISIDYSEQFNHGGYIFLTVKYWGLFLEYEGFCLESRHGLRTRLNRLH